MAKKITQISIKNYKGIKNHTFDFIDFYANKLNLLIAPNGFGKTSFACCFDNLMRGKLGLPEKYWHGQNSAYRPELNVKIDFDGNVEDLLADDNQNMVSNKFSVKVIKSKITTKTNQGFGHAKATSKITHEQLCLIDKAPKNPAWGYKKSKYNTIFKDHRSHVSNILDFLNNDFNFTLWLRHFADLHKLTNKTSEKLLAYIEASALDETGLSNVVSAINSYQPHKLIYEKIQSPNIEESIITFHQLLTEYRTNGTALLNHIKHQHYLRWKNNLEETISSLQLANNGGATLSQSGGKLYFVIDDINQISNGERDSLSFLAQLFSAEYALLYESSKENCLLIIDEIFDYLDEANLIACQYFVSKLIQNFKEVSRSVFPIILTHLPPREFEAYRLGKTKLHFLKQRSSKYKNQLVRDIIAKRAERDIPISDLDILSKHFLHFSDRTHTLPANVSAHSLANVDFYTQIDQELKNYIEGKNYDPFSICVSIRVNLEKYAHSKINNLSERNVFLATKYTDKKLAHAEKCGAEIPEIFFLLGILYNEALHKERSQHLFYENRIEANLQNEILSGMIKTCATLCGLG